MVATAKDIRLEIDKEFNQCIASSKKSRQKCSFGGCGAIMANCYQQSIASISSKADEISDLLKINKCRKFEKSANESIDDLNEKLQSLEPLDGTWSGFEVQKEVAFLRLYVMKQILDECH